MESVPTMSYSASPVQGAFGLNHFRAWRANRAARKQAAYAASLAAQLNQRRSMADDMASAAAGRRWQTYQRDRRTEDLNELNGNTEPMEAMTFAPDEDMSGPLAAAGSAAAAAQMVQGGGPAADDVDFDGLLPEAPGHRPRLGWQR